MDVYSLSLVGNFEMRLRVTFCKSRTSWRIVSRGEPDKYETDLLKELDKPETVIKLLTMIYVLLNRIYQSMKPFI